MAKIGRKSHNTPAPAAAGRAQVDRAHAGTHAQGGAAQVVTLTGKMTVFGSFKRIPGLLEAPRRRPVSEVLDVLNNARPGAEFIGRHAGRRVVGVRHRACACIEFADCRSSYLPPLPTTEF